MATSAKPNVRRPCRRLCGLLLLLCILPASAATVDDVRQLAMSASRSQARYTACAAQADREGLAGTAVLFRALARSSAVETDNCLRLAGGSRPVAGESPAAASTRQNLAAALQGEADRADRLVPGFIPQAKRELAVEALKAINYARGAADSRRRLLTQALQATVDGRVKAPLFVCSVCGYIVIKIDFDTCPSCFFPKDRYFEVD